MLHRSFKPAKCKTSLKLASARLKLLKNRKDVQVMQLKRELAKLLESGEERTARIQVENVIREDKMVAAYGLLEIYCELIAARLQIIESQKNCPIDLKEAITSVIFAAPRCSDVTELQDIRKQLTAKYGKEFVAAAVELRPDCGVSRLLVEKLSVNATDGQSKMKILKGIADEHGVKWEPVLLEQNELKASQDLLDGPKTFVRAKIQADPPPPPPVQTTMPPTFQPPPAQTTMPPPAFQPPQSHYYSNFGSNTNERFNHEYENTSVKRHYSFHEEVFSPTMKNQNMEFENAAAAAKAAAESAEIACRAAREAAEFANQGKFSRQPSTDSQFSMFSDHSRNEEERRKDDRDSRNHSFQQRNSQLRDSVNHSRSDSLKSKTSYIDDNAERYSPKNYFSPDPRLKKQSSSCSDSVKSKASSIDENAEKYSPRNYFSTKEQSLKKQSSSSPGRQSDSPFDNVHYYSEERLTRKISYEKTSAVFDDYGSDDDDNHEVHTIRKNDGPKPEQVQSHHDVMPVTFADSEGGHSSDEETDKSVFYDHKPSKFSPPSIRRDSDVKLKESSLKTEKMLNLETLRGGFKHQKSGIPPFTSPTAQIYTKKPRDDPVTAYDSDGDNSNAVIPPSPPSRKRESNFTPTRLQPKTTYFDPSYESESETEEEHRPTSSSSQVSGKTNRHETSSSVLSWRTKPTPNNPRPTEASPETRRGPGNYTKPVSFRQRTDVNPPKQQSSNKEQLKMPSSTTTTTGEGGSAKQSFKKEQLKMSSLSSTATGEGGSATSVHNSENSLKTSGSHVHPKLPDYDDIAARFQSLRVNRR